MRSLQARDIGQYSGADGALVPAGRTLCGSRPALASRIVETHEKLRGSDAWDVHREQPLWRVAGRTLGIVGFGRALLWGSTMPLALTVGVSILVICAWANTVGAMIPMLATMFKIDPTVMSAPLIATLVDATGLIIYFTIAKSFLGL